VKNTPERNAALMSRLEQLTDGSWPFRNVACPCCIGETRAGDLHDQPFCRCSLCAGQCAVPAEQAVRWLRGTTALLGLRLPTRAP
jgi:hypothetical protein